MLFRSKVQVIDKYGRTCWVTVEQAKNHEIPMYANGPANIDKGYRPAYIGEEELVSFIKAYLGIPNCMKYTDGVWTMIDNPEEAEAMFSNIPAIIKGELKEIKSAINSQPNNKLRVLFGLKSNDEGRMYSTVFTDMFMKYNYTSTDKLGKLVNERQSAGAYSNVEFFIGKYKEYAVEATSFDTPEADPFGAPVANNNVEEDPFFSASNPF